MVFILHHSSIFGAVRFEKNSPRLMLPYCLQIEASEKEQVFTSFSGSASCPLGSAVSGWYNLPSVPVKAGSLGGPANFTGLQLFLGPPFFDEKSSCFPGTLPTVFDEKLLFCSCAAWKWPKKTTNSLLRFCRQTGLLSFCAQPLHSHCSKGLVVASVSYSSNNFKLGCCQLQSRLGLRLTGQSPLNHAYQDFEGYYCPSKIGITGAAIYSKTHIPSLGDPGVPGGAIFFSLKIHQLFVSSVWLASNPGTGTKNWTLSWNKFKGSWQLRTNAGLAVSWNSFQLSFLRICSALLIIVVL